MKKIPIKYNKPGEKVKEESNYYCHVCGTESGTEEVKLKKGQRFGECQNCGISTLWIKKKK
ncbi:MAG: hypothetical protein A2474_03715 [Elusimicrobia bacterium RIFOXYC2_FULL_34_12]|nr:MAG: hypothetical protein A2474_03715 [Elusimicrobia bacterium RIFOXYC2_FULL_34_12]OGS38679.1 MAG: hypothetical protein A2551_05210 [Elusimicrobia bacterium RIFOXYD2_FULL_34_30]HAM39548.1 hypothetical protein [Elusimicrobiota bacterium]